MIAKRVPRPKGTSDFARLGRYVVDARGRVDPTTWETWARVSDYLLDAGGGGAKVGAVRVTNCHTDDDPAAAALEVRAVQARNTRSRGDKCYHLVVAFPPGERPTPAQLADIEDTLCAAIGLAEHQRLSAVHTDRDHLHLHVAINTVHPRTFRNVAPYYDHHRLMEACERLELTHGLTRTNHGRRSDRGAQAGATADAQAAAPATEPRGRAADMEAHSRRESFQGWVADEAAAALRVAVRAADGWQALHVACARFDLELRPRGAGLVLVPRRAVSKARTAGRDDRFPSVKASTVDRALSLPALVRRWGPYEPPAAAALGTAPERRYDGGPLAAGRGSTAGGGTAPPTAPTGARGTDALYAAFLRARETADSARRAALGAEQEARAAVARRLAAAHAAQRAALRRAVHLDRPARQRAFEDLRAQRAADWTTARRAGAAARAGVRAAHPLPTWAAFLEDAATRGDEHALAALRHRRGQVQRLVGNLLAAESGAEVRHVIRTSLTPRLQKNGDVRYTVQDGGAVTDAAAHVRVDEHTAGAAVLALALAGDRFAGQALDVRGTDAFRREVAEYAGRAGLPVRFADPSLERVRADQGHRSPDATPAPARPVARTGGRSR